MLAKKLLWQMTEKDRHCDDGRRHSFISLIMDGVNWDQTLNACQQGLVRRRVTESYTKLRLTDDSTVAKEAMEIAGFINTCRYTNPVPFE